MTPISQFLRIEIMENTPCFAKAPLFPKTKAKANAPNEPGAGSNGKGRDPMQTD